MAVADPERRARNRAYHERWRAANAAHLTSYRAGRKALESERAEVRNVLRHGLSLNDYDLLLIAQRGCCAICGRTQSSLPRRLDIDHDHGCCPGTASCGRCVRGLLCSDCNRGLFHFDPATLRAAADYFERTVR